MGRPDPDHGEEVVAFLSLEAGAELSPEEMAAWSREHIGGYKYPREVHLLDAIPLTESVVALLRGLGEKFGVEFPR